MSIPPEMLPQSQPQQQPDQIDPMQSSALAAIMQQEQPQQQGVQGVDPIHVQSLILQQMGMFLTEQMTSMQGGTDPKWNLDVYTKALDTLATAFDKLEPNGAGMTGEQQFELEAAKQQFDMNLDIERMNMDREKHELDLEIKQAEAAQKMRMQQEQAQQKMQLDRESAHIKATQANQQAQLKAATTAHNASLAQAKQSKELEIKEKQAQQQPKAGTE